MPFTKDAPKDGNKKITEMLSAEKYPNTVSLIPFAKDAPDGKAKKAPAFADALNFAHIK